VLDRFILLQIVVCASRRSVLAIPSHSGRQQRCISPSDLRLLPVFFRFVGAFHCQDIHFICLKDHLGFPACLLICSRLQSVTAYSSFYGIQSISFCCSTLRYPHFASTLLRHWHDTGNGNVKFLQFRRSPAYFPASTLPLPSDVVLLMIECRPVVWKSYFFVPSLTCRSEAAARLVLRTECRTWAEPKNEDNAYGAIAPPREQIVKERLQLRKRTPGESQKQSSYMEK
jgi:hypothetical protein